MSSTSVVGEGVWIALKCGAGAAVTAWYFGHSPIAFGAAAAAGGISARVIADAYKTGKAGIWGALSAGFYAPVITSTGVIIATGALCYSRGAPLEIAPISGLLAYPWFYWNLIPP